MARYAPALLVTLVLLHGGASAAVRQVGEDWPRWRGAHFDDASRAEGLFGGPVELRVRWRGRVGTGYSALSVLGDVAVTMGSEQGSDFVVALGANDGGLRWRHRLGPAFSGTDGASDGPVSTPTLTPDDVYALGPRGDLVALDLETGERRWVVDLVREHGALLPHWGFTTSPIVVGQLVVVQAGGPDGRAVVALERASGALRWSTGDDLIEYQSPILARLYGIEQLVCSGETDLFGLVPETGEELWRHAHGGSEFYSRIVNPLVLGENRLFLKNRASTSRMLRIGPPGEGWPCETDWETRHLAHNYNLPVLHDGMIFGHDGSTLACIDASSGARLWRSRPPGNGWVVLVDGHLVVLTKAGTLHVARAQASGYEELAHLELFDRLTWTPPALAHRCVYARDSFGSAACVEIVAAEGAPEPTLARASGGTLVADLRLRLAGAQDPAAEVEAFLASQTSFPVIEEGHAAHVFYRGEEADVAVGGDMLAGVEATPMERLAGSNLFVASFELPPRTRLGYWLELDFEDPVPDPLNGRRSVALGVGAVSELVVSGDEEPEEPEGAPAELAGKLESFEVDTPQLRVGGETWGGPRRIDVYLPPGYAEGETRYPTLWVNDGAKALASLGLLETLERVGPPAIVVFVESISYYELARSQREPYRRLVVDELVPTLDERYRTLASPRSRAIVGFDEGAYAALTLGLLHPGVFGGVGAQSIYPGSRQCADELRRLVEQAECLPIVYLDWGRFDDRRPTGEIDAPAFSRAAFDLLSRRGATVHGGEHLHGDTFGCWKARLPALLDVLLPPSR